MKYIKPLIVALLLCAFYPGLSFADPLNDAVTAISDKDFKKACDLLIPLAEENNLSAKNLLGLLYFKGEGVEQDVAKGLSMIMDAAKQGYDPAKANALALTSELAALGEPVAMFNAGFMCLKGWGGEQDPNVCVKLIEKSGESGHAKSAKFLASLYKNGKYGIPPNKEKADYWDSKIQE